MAAWLGLKYQSPQMVKQGCGAIVNTAFVTGTPMPVDAGSTAFSPGSRAPPA